MTSDASGMRSPQPSFVAAQYETLRTAGLGGPLPPEARGGLALFLRRGMWGWARVLSFATTSERSAPRPSFAATGPYQHRAVIQILAAMATNVQSRGAL